MPLDKNTLKSRLIEIFSEADTDSNIETVAAKMADAIDTYVKSGTVTGTCPSGGGALQVGKVT